MNDSDDTTPTHGRDDCNDTNDCYEPGHTDSAVNVADTGLEVETDVAPVVVGPTSHLTSMALRMHVKFEATGAAQSILQLLAINGILLEDCEASFVGAGTLWQSVAGENTYEGTFEKVAGTCVPLSAVPSYPQLSGTTLDDGIIVPAGGVGYHTFLFSPELDRMTHWVEHEARGMSTPSLQPQIDRQYWLRFTDPQNFDFDAFSLVYLREEVLVMGGVLPFHVRIRFEAQFSEDATPPVLKAFPLLNP